MNTKKIALMLALSSLSAPGTLVRADTLTFNCTVVDRTVRPFTNRQYEIPIGEIVDIPTGSKRHTLQLRNHENILLAEVSLASTGQTLIHASVHSVGGVQLRDPDLEFECSAVTVP